MIKTVLLTQTGQTENLNFHSEMGELLNKAIGCMPLGKERSMFITKMEEAVFWGARSLAMKEGNHSRVHEFPIRAEQPVDELRKEVGQMKVVHHNENTKSKRLFAFKGTRRNKEIIYKEVDYGENAYYKRAPEHDTVIH